MSKLPVAACRTSNPASVCVHLVNSEVPKKTCCHPTMEPITTTRPSTTLQRSAETKL